MQPQSGWRDDRNSVPRCSCHAPPVVGGGEEETVDGLRVLERRDDVLVVALDDDDLLRGLVDLQHHLGEVLGGAGPRTLVVDLGGVRLLSSATIGVLLRTRRRCRARGGRVVLRGLSRPSRDVLRRTGLSPLFDTVGANGLGRA